LLHIKDELSDFCVKYNTIPLFVHDCGMHVMINDEKSITELQDISTIEIKFMKNYDLDINGCIGFGVKNYGQACKIYSNINELSIFSNNKLSTEIKGFNDIKHFRTNKKEIMYVRLHHI